MTTEYVFDLSVTPDVVELVGPGSASIDDQNDLVLTSERRWVWLSISEVCDRFDGVAEGWQVQTIDCGDGNGGGGEERAGKRGVILRFKGQIDSGTIETVSGAPKVTITVGDVEVEIPVGPSETKVTRGAHADALGKFRLCPDGRGGFVVTVEDLDPANDTIVRPREIRLFWELSN